MRLLITTQVVDRNDPILGYFHTWIEQFARSCESIEVLCLKCGEYDLPPNVTVRSLGKESGGSRFHYILRFYKNIISQRDTYDAVFVHMNPEYVVLGGLLWRIMGKRVGLWYTHGSVNMWLKIAAHLAHRVFTASEESFKIATHKKLVVGHGVVFSSFVKEDYQTHSPFSLITVGRISPVKNILLLILMLEELRSTGLEASLTIIGGALDADGQVLERSLQLYAHEHELLVHFMGPLPNAAIPEMLVASDMFVSASGTGSLDKALLEALSVGLPVATSNAGAASMLKDVDARALVEQSAAALAQRVRDVASMPTAERHRLGTKCREYVVREHSLNGLIPRICADYE